MTNNEPINIDALRASQNRRLAALRASTFIPNDAPARRTPPALRRTRRTSVRHRSIR
jgi:hypothetical protein